MKHPIPVTLSESDRASLHTFIHAGKANARTFSRARVLLKAAEGWTDQEICVQLASTARPTIIGMYRLKRTLARMQAIPTVNESL